MGGRIAISAASIKWEKHSSRFFKTENGCKKNYFKKYQDISAGCSKSYKSIDRMQC